MAERLTGQVTMYSPFKRYGFILAGRKEYFVHVSAVRALGKRGLDVGDKVEFTPKSSEKGEMAIDVHLVNNEKSEEVDRWVFMKKNPFTPQDPVTDPGKFAGRKAAFINAVDAIYNSKNVLLSGPRGIGKSSIAYQLLYLASGDNSLADRLGIDLGGEKFNRITGDHRCTPDNDLQEIAQSLITTLLHNLGLNQLTNETEEKAELSLKFFKLEKTEKKQPISCSDLVA